MTGAERECIREIVDSLWLARRAHNLQTSVLDDAAADLHDLALYLRYETAHQRAHNAAIKTCSPCKRTVASAIKITRNGRNRSSGALSNMS